MIHYASHGERRNVVNMGEQMCLCILSISSSFLWWKVVFSWKKKKKPKKQLTWSWLLVWLRKFTGKWKQSLLLPLISFYVSLAFTAESKNSLVFSKPGAICELKQNWQASPWRNLTHAVVRSCRTATAQMWFARFIQINWALIKNSTLCFVLF